jgi:hypothetical protein
VAGSFCNLKLHFNALNTSAPECNPKFSSFMKTIDDIYDVSSFVLSEYRVRTVRYIAHREYGLLGLECNT